MVARLARYLVLVVSQWIERKRNWGKKKIYLHSGVSTMKNFNMDSWHFWGNPDLWLLGSLPVSAEVISCDSSYQIVLRSLVCSCRNWFDKSTKHVWNLPPPPPPPLYCFSDKAKIFRLISGDLRSLSVPCLPRYDY